MSTERATRLLRELQSAAALYHRLVLLVAPAEVRSAVLQQLSWFTGAPLFNLNLELSRRLVERPQQQRPLAVQPALEELLAAAGGDTVLLDHPELLFEPSLAQEPLRLLELLSRTRTLVVGWPGCVEAGQLLYAEAGHPEYRSYPAHDLTLVEL